MCLEHEKLIERTDNDDAQRHPLLLHALKGNWQDIHWLWIMWLREMYMAYADAPQHKMGLLPNKPLGSWKYCKSKMHLMYLASKQHSLAPHITGEHQLLPGSHWVDCDSLSLSSIVREYCSTYHSSKSKILSLLYTAWMLLCTTVKSKSPKSNYC